MYDSILVTLSKMRPLYSQSSRENATPSSDTFPLASYKEVPSPGYPGTHQSPFLKSTAISLGKKHKSNTVTDMSTFFAESKHMTPTL